MTEKIVSMTKKIFFVMDPIFPKYRESIDNLADTVSEMIRGRIRFMAWIVSRETGHPRARSCTQDTASQEQSRKMGYGQARIVSITPTTYLGEFFR